MRGRRIPTMRRFVPVKTDDNQPALLLVDLRDRLIRNRTLLANAIRNYPTEYGLIAAKERADRTAARAYLSRWTLPDWRRELFALMLKKYAQLQTHLKDVDARLMA